jgi:hypothetical protein
LKHILKLIYDHFKSHVGLKIAVAFFVLGGMFIGFNYTFDFEDSFVDTEPNPWLRFVWMFLFQSIPYLATCGLVYAFNLDRTWIRSWKFWTLFVIGFSLLAIDRSWSLWPMVEGCWPEEEIHFLYRIINKGKGVITIIIPLALLAMFLEKKNPTNIFGLAIRNFDARPYFIILAIGLGCIGFGGFFSDIQEFYPKYSRSYGGIYADFNGIPEWVAVVMYEIPYGFDFISTEYFFRGFLVIGMYRILGPHAILPMVMTYCVLHFGKPMTEAISSIFGGYILGVIAMHHRNIWGGVIIHVGIAWGMELVGFIANRL